MEIIKLVAIFVTIVVLLAFRRPLNLVMTISSVLVILLYPMPLSTLLPSLREGFLGFNTIKTVLLLYSITYLQRMMEARRQLIGCQEAMNGLFNNRRINASLVPLLLGCLPAASTVLICGPIVRQSVGDALSTGEKAACTSYFRHITEAFLPTYTNIAIALSFTGGLVSPAVFVIAMLPIVCILFLTGWLVYLRRVPKDTGMVPDRSKGAYVKLFFQSVWPIFLAIVLVLLLRGLPVFVAVLIALVINIFVNHFSLPELRTFIKTAFERRLILNTISIMVFGSLLSATGVIALLPGYFSRLPIPSFLVYALLFFFGTLVAHSQAIAVLCVPMAISSVAGGPFLALFVLVMGLSYLAMQIAPTHICLTLCAEDYKISLGALIVKVMPMVVVAAVFIFFYYFVLCFLGF